jgi:hypothetical protein
MSIALSAARGEIDVDTAGAISSVDKLASSLTSLDQMAGSGAGAVDKFSAQVNDGLAKVGTAATQMEQAVTSSVTATSSSVDTLGSAADKAGSDVTTAFTGIGDAGTQAGQSISTAATTAGDSLSTLGTSAASAADGITSGLSGASDSLSALGDAAQGAASGVEGAMGDAAASVGQVGGAVSGAADEATGAFGRLVLAATEVVSQWGQVKDAANESIGGIGDAATEATGRVVGTFQNIGAAAVEGVGIIASSLGLLHVSFDDVAKAAGDTGAQIAAGLKGASESVDQLATANKGIAESNAQGAASFAQLGTAAQAANGAITSSTTDAAAAITKVGDAASSTAGEITSANDSASGSFTQIGDGAIEAASGMQDLSTSAADAAGSVIDSSGAASGSIEEVGGAASDMGAAVQDAGAASTDALNGIVDGANSVSESLGETVKSMNDIVSSGANGIAASIGNVFPDFAGQVVEESRTVEGLRRTFGDATDEMLKFADAAHSTTLFNKDELLGAEQQVAVLSRNYGLTAQQLEQVITLSENLATVSGKSLENTTQAVVSAIEGHTRAAQQYGLTLSKNAIDLDNVTSSMTAQQAAQYRLTAALQQGTFAEGAAAEEAQTLSGRLQNYGKQVFDFEKSIVSGISPIAQASVGIGEFGDKAKTAVDVFKQLGDGASEMRTHIDEGVTTMSNFASTGLGVGVAAGVITLAIVGAIAAFDHFNVTAGEKFSAALSQANKAADDFNTSMGKVATTMADASQAMVFSGAPAAFDAARKDLESLQQAEKDLAAAIAVSDVGKINDLAAAMVNLQKQYGDGATAAAALADAQTKLQYITSQTGRGATEMQADAANALQQFEAGTLGVQGLAAALDYVVQNQEHYVDEAAQMEQANNAAASSFNTLGAAVVTVLQSDAPNTLKDSVTGILDATSQVIDSLRAFATTNDRVWSLTGGIQAYDKVLENVKTILSDTGENAVTYQGYLAALNELHQSGAINADTYATAVQHLVDDLGTANVQTAEAAYQSDKYSESLNRAQLSGKDFAGDLAPKLTTIRDLLAGTAEAADRNAESNARLGASHAQLTGAIVDEMGARAAQKQAITDYITGQRMINDLLPKEVTAHAQLTDSITNEMAARAAQKQALTDYITGQRILNDLLPREVTAHAQLSTQIVSEMSARSAQAKALSDYIMGERILNDLLPREVTFRAQLSTQIVSEMAARAAQTKTLTDYIMGQRMLNDLLPREVTFRAQLSAQIVSDMSARATELQTLTNYIMGQRMLNDLLPREVTFRAQLSGAVASDMAARAAEAQALTNYILGARMLNDLLPREITYRAQLSDGIVQSMSARETEAQALTNYITGQRILNDLLPREVTFRAQLSTAIEKEITDRAAQKQALTDYITGQRMLNDLLPKEVTSHEQLSTSIQQEIGARIAQTRALSDYIIGLRIVADLLPRVSSTDATADRMALSFNKATYAIKSALTEHQQFDDTIQTADDRMNNYLDTAVKAANALQVLSTNAQLFQAAGIKTPAIDIAVNLQGGQNALKDVFGAIVGQTQAMGQQLQGTSDWATKLIGDPGQWAQVDKLLADGRINLDQYNAAQRAEVTITQANANAQQDLLAIQTNLAPVIAEAALNQARYIDSLQDADTTTQLAALGYMDAGESAKAMSLAQLAAASTSKVMQTQTTEMIQAAAAADPVLKAMLEDMGLIDAQTGEVKFTTNAKDIGTTIDALSKAIKQLTKAIDLYFTEHGADDATEKTKNLGKALDDLPTQKHVEFDATGAHELVDDTKNVHDQFDNWPKSVDTTIHAHDNASTTLDDVKQKFDALDGHTATTYVKTIHQDTNDTPTAPRPTATVAAAPVTERPQFDASLLKAPPAQSFKVTADTAQAASALKTIADQAKTFTGQTFTAHLDLDDSKAAAALTSATTLTTAWQGATFSATFNIDNGPAAVAYTDAFTWGTVFAATTFTGFLALDNGQAAVSYTDAFSWGETWAGQTFTSTFSADNGPAAVAYTDAFSWGETWNGHPFTAIFDIDNGPAAVAYTDAFSWGDTWAGTVFTASFSVDTSGITNAVAVAQAAAAQIAAIMPHSPAKEGPLKEPIKFDYIADEMKSSMAALVGHATGGVNDAAQVINGLTVNSRARMAGLTYQAGAQTWRGADRANQAARVTFVSVHSKDWQKMVDRIEATGQYIDEFEHAIYADEGQ